MNNVLLDPIFNLQTVPPIKPGNWLDDTSTILEKVSVETARPIVLTQDRSKLLNPKRNYVYLPPSASIEIHADEVTVSGKLSFPGQNVVIVTRVLGAEDDGSNPASISVDGAALPEEKAHPAFLKKGVAPKGKPEKAGKVSIGKPEWSARDHPNEMNGEDGDKGEPGNAAGNVWICCQKTSFDGTEHKLTITANGGPGGDGQRGQDGADGGPGHDGRDFSGGGVIVTYPEQGTKGGDGGNGGKGGKAGQGGNGGSILFHCITSQPNLGVNYARGDPGARGKGGDCGGRGRGGQGGKGGVITRSYGQGPPVIERVDDAARGPEGELGRPGDEGDKADPSKPGSGSITWGEVDYAALVQMASITQLQMLFEHTRADYLVTEPPNYSLRLMAVAPLKDSTSSAPDLVNEGTNLIVVGRSRGGLHVRIFDGSGEIVADKQEPEIIEAQKRFHISMADVLEAGNWVTPEDLDRMSAKDRQALMSSGGQRGALIDQLSRISGLEKYAFNELNDYDLTGWGAVTAFLLQMGIRDEAGLKIRLEGYRNAVINAVVPEIARNTGYNEASLRKLKDQELVRVALDPELLSPAPKNKFVLRGGMDFLRHQLFSQIPPITLSDVLQAGGWITAHDLSWMQHPDHRKAIINQLRWKTGLVNEFHERLYDRDLIGFGAVMAFLLQMGIRDEAGFKGDRQCGRSILIGELAGKCGYDRNYLEGLHNEELVRLALDPKPTNQFALRGNMVSLRKQLFRPMSLAEVLQAGNWLTPAELDDIHAGKMSAQDQRQALIHRLSLISNLQNDNFEKLNDDDLIGFGAVVAFLLEMGIRDKAGLKANLEDYRNTLIVEVAGNCGYDGGYLQGRRNLELVQLALEPKQQNKFVIRGGMLLLQQRLLGTEKVAALKRLFEMSLSDVLRAGGWVAPDRLKAMSAQDQRQAVIDQLSRISGLPKDDINKLNDYDLIGRGAVTVFLLQAGIRDEAGLKVNVDHRTALIMEVAAKCGYDQQSLQGLDNYQLVRVALEPKPGNKFVIRGGMAFLRDWLFGQMLLPDVLEAGGWVPADRLSSMSAQDKRKALIDQLSRISGLPKAEFDELNAYDLIGRGAVAACLLQMGIRDEAGLKGPLQGHRDILIKEAAAKAGYDEQSLKGLDNHQLVRFALEPKPGNKFVPLGGMVLLRNRLFPGISLAEVLQAGGWVAPDRLGNMSIQDQRQVIIDELSRITGRPWDEIFTALRNDHALAACGVAAAFLLQMGIRDEAGLKGPLRILRDTLIKETAANTSYEQYLLQGLDNQQLVRLALEPRPGNKLVPRGGMVPLRNRLFPAMSLPDALQAGNWRTPAQLDKMSAQDQRQALIDELSRLTGLAKAEFSALNDYDLIGRGLAIAFLLQMGIRDEAGLKKGDLDQHRNTLAVEVEGNCGYEVGYLKGLDNQQLVRLALEPKRTNHFVLRGNLLDLRDRFCDVSNMPMRKQEGTIAFAADIANYTDTWSSIGQRLEWLLHLLKAASKDHPEKALAKTIQPSVWSAINNHIDGLDYYGHTPDWVPFLSLGTYLEVFDTSVSRLEGIEKAHKEYFAAWNDQKAATDYLKTALGSVDDHRKFLSERIKKVKKDKKDTEMSIIDKDNARKGLEDSLKQRLEKVDKDVQGAFGLTWNTFLNCLSQLGFASFSEPARALKTVSKAGGFLKADRVEGGAVVGGFASAGAMVAGPLGMMLDEASTSIVNDSGQSVKKNWLLQQIDVIRGDLDLKSGLKDRIDGFMTYTESQRLVVELSKFEELCKQFRNSVSGQAQLSKDLDAYIENITSRNHYIDYYNALVQDLMDLLGDQKKLETRKSVVEGQLAATSNPGLPAMATFVSALFERAKAECLYDFYLAKRAYSFWALEPYSDFFETIQSPGAITSKSLKSAHGDLTDEILKRLEGKGLKHASGSVNFSPARDKSEGSLGIVVVLSRESHPDFFQDLKRDNKADFELEPATFASTTPSKTFAPTTGVAWSGERPELDPSTPHPFHGMANVRLTKARPWILGFYTGSGTTTVRLTHLGAERFRSWKDKPYPPFTDDQEPEYVSHEHKDINFRYSSTGLSWSPVADNFTPGQLFVPGTSGTEDGDLGFPQPGAGLKDKQESIYAPIGPFGKWRLTVRPEDNTDDPKNKPLNWDTVEAVVIDFHVFAEGFSSEIVSSARAAAGR